MKLLLVFAVTIPILLQSAWAGLGEGTKAYKPEACGDKEEVQVIRGLQVSTACRTADKSGSSLDEEGRSFSDKNAAFPAYLNFMIVESRINR